ncbi:MAG: hypothetical protein WCL56_13380 [Sediminibacterium sp.]
MYSQELKNKWHDDPKNWKLGIFYFNKEDKRLVISKRLKLFGWTLNFANPLSYIIMIALGVVIFYLKQHHIKTNYPFG